MGKKALAPGLQRFSIVEAKNLDVGDKQPRSLDHGQHLGQRRNIAPRENVLRDPRISDAAPFRTADRMEQHHAVITEELHAFLKKGAVITNAHMLEHADRNNAVEWPAYIAIILHEKLGALAQSSTCRAIVRAQVLLLR